MLNIIADNLKDINPDDDDEIELDVDQLDNQTLWRLREYCDTVNNKQAVKTAPSKAGAGGGSRSAHENGKQQQHSSKPPARTESGSGVSPQMRYRMLQCVMTPRQTGGAIGYGDEAAFRSLSACLQCA